MSCCAFEPEQAGLRFWIDDEDATRVHLDVRGFLGDGEDPGSTVVECVQRLVIGQRLVVHAEAEQRCLMGCLGRMGYFLEARQAGPANWELEVSAA